jgi:hypothetical protein
VLVTENLESPPSAAFIFETILVDSRSDIAILRYSGRWKGSKLDIAALPSFRYGDGASIGSAVDLRLNDDIIILGYPGYDFGGRKPITLTITNGKVSGFMEDSSVAGLPRAWIKTDALASWGNSGGLVIDASGRFIGIPTEVALDPKGGRLALLRPIDLMKPFFEYVAANPKAPAVGVGGSTGKLPSAATVAATAPRTTAAGSRSSSAPRVSEGVFATRMDGDEMPVNPGAVFAAAEAPRLIAFFDYSGFSDGSRCEYVWSRDGKQLYVESVPWELGESGSTYASYINSKGGMPVGAYKFSITLDGKTVFEKTVTVVETKQTADSKKPAMSVSGLVVDASTQRPVVGAVIAVIQPEFTAEQFIAKQDEAMLAAIVRPDSKGYWKTEEALVPGATYALVAVARGYASYIAPKGVTIPMKAADDRIVRIELSRSK